MVPYRLRIIHCFLRLHLLSVLFSTTLSCTMSTISSSSLSALLAASAVEAQELAGSNCPRVNRPSPLEFMRDFVHPNRPCVIMGAIHDWPALDKWTGPGGDAYLASRFGDHQIKINATPNGRGDAVLDGQYFVLPEERTMTYSQFIDAKRDGADILYLSHQDDNLRKQLQGLILDDIAPSFPIADEALGSKPDAVNLWVGDSQAITTLHKDHYENLYAVVRGAKHFTLYPPTSLPLLYPTSYVARQYAKHDGEWILANPSGANEATFGGTHQWIAADPQNPDFEAHPLFSQAVPVRVTVKPGEVLFLPSMWYHQVGQDDDTVAVNYWYDMSYDSRYVHHTMLASLVDLAAAGVSTG